MAGKILDVSERTMRPMKLVLLVFDDTNGETAYDDSCLPEDDHFSSSDHNSNSEISLEGVFDKFISRK
jgi:hypothetical protein